MKTRRVARKGGDSDHKLARLCEEVRELASLALATSEHWRDLEDLLVVEVLPGDAGRVTVLLAPSRMLKPDETERAEQALQRVRGYVRTEIAEALQRKRALDVALVLLPSRSMQEGLS